MADDGWIVIKVTNAVAVHGLPKFSSIRTPQLEAEVRIPRTATADEIQKRVMAASAMLSEIADNSALAELKAIKAGNNELAEFIKESFEGGK